MAFRDFAYMVIGAAMFVVVVPALAAGAAGLFTYAFVSEIAERFLSSKRESENLPTAREMARLICSQAN